MVAELSRVRLIDLEVDISAVGQDKPPTLTEIRYAIRVRAEVDEEKLARLLSLAERNSMVVSTPRLAIPVSGEISKNRPSCQAIAKNDVYAAALSPFQVI